MSARDLAIALPGGWTALTPAGALVTIAGFYAPAVRLWGDVVQMRGELGTSIPNGTTLTTIPAAFRPASSVRMVVAASGPVVGSITIAPTGVVTFFATATATAVSFDGLSYSFI